MSDRTEGGNLSSALGSIPQVNNQRAFKTTVTLVGTGTGDVDINDVSGAIKSQNTIFDLNETTYDQLYIHRFRVYGTAGGYLSMSPYPHRQYAINPPANGSSVGVFGNSYSGVNDQNPDYRRGALTQMYGKWNLLRTI